jgi:hypothetical protein
MVFERKNVTEHKMCGLIFSKKLSETFLITGTDRDVIIYTYWYSWKVSIIRVTF